MTSSKPFPLFWFALIVAINLGMFLLLGWKVSNTYSVSMALKEEFARGLDLGSDILATHLRLVHIAHLIARDGNVQRLDCYRREEGHLQNYLDEADRLAAADPVFDLLSPLADLNPWLRETEREALLRRAGGDPDDVEALLQAEAYLDLGQSFERTVNGYMTGLRTAFSERLYSEAKAELFSIVAAIVIFGATVSIWLLLMNRLRRWRAALSREMSLRQNAEEQLRESQKMAALGQLAAGVAHDFNNILSVVHGFAAVARHRISTDQPVEEALGKIVVAASQGHEITRSLLTFSGRSGVEMDAVDLAGLVQETAKLLRDTLPAGIELELANEARGAACWVTGNRAQLQQVLINLALNSRDAMPEGGHLRIGLTPHTEQVGKDVRSWFRLSVQDEGSGIPESIRDRVFEPFFTTKSRRLGTGLGLSLAAAVTKDHAGKISFSSEFGKGTSFVMDLPGMEPEEAAEWAGRGNGELVLVLFEDSYVGDLLATAIGAYGYVVERLASVEGLQGSLRKRPPDLLVVDADLLSRPDGRETGGFFLAPLGIPVLVLEKEKIDNEIEFHGSAETLSLRKPFRVSDLIWLVNDLVARHAGEKSENSGGR